MSKILSNEYISPEIKELFETVVDGGYCIGCGACASVEGSPIVMKLDEFSMFKATINPSVNVNNLTASIQSVCPFSNASENEDSIGKELYGPEATYHDKIGYYLSTYAGHVVEGDFRKNGSSGGMGSWIAASLLNAGLVDSVIHIHQRQPTGDDRRLFHYQLSTTINEVTNSAKSRYYPIELSEMMTLIRQRPGRYVIVGIPCFIKSIRLLAKQDEKLGERIKFCIGLICGHLKSARFAELFAWQCDIPPAKLSAINFRTKLDGHGANRYGVTVKGIIDNHEITKISPPINKIYGANWGFGFFKYKACDYCDDVVAETADVTIGDAWLPQYVNDGQGTNVVIVRNSIIKKLIEDARQENRLSFDDITPSEVVKSQNSGFEHRRAGLSYRLSRADKKGHWRPMKRVQPSNSEEINMKQELRIEMADLSHIAFNKAIQENKFETFIDIMKPVVKKYQLLYKQPIWVRVINKVKYLIGKN
jgi:coenzyme F420 hydrogenase subunit beta